MMKTDAYRTSFHVARADDEHGVDTRLLGVGDLGLDGCGAEVRLHADHGRAEFVHDGLGVINQRRVVVECDDADLVGCEPEREVAGVMFRSGSR